MGRPAFATLSKDKLLSNVAVLRKRLPSTKIVAMVKANAYGHGIRSVGIRIDGLVDVLGVASINEALILRSVGVKSPILLIQGVYEQTELEIAANAHFDIVVHNHIHVEWLTNTVLPHPLSCWIKVNTGLGRLGFSMTSMRTVYDDLKDHKNVQKPLKIMSHFACSEVKDHPINQQQIQEFRSIMQYASAEFSLCNSAGIINFPQAAFDYVRPGVLLYGVSPIKGIFAQNLGFQPIMTMQSKLISVQNMHKGASIGYGARYRCPEAMPIGIVAFGYGDGYPQTAADGTPVLVNQHLCSLVGCVSMDMLAVDLRNYPEARVGDPVILWGEELPVEQVVMHSKNHVWNVLSGIQNRVKFNWID